MDFNINKQDIDLSINKKEITLEISKDSVYIENYNAPPGLSAYQLAVINGFLGTEEEWLLSLKGDAGLDNLPDYTLIFENQLI